MTEEELKPLVARLVGRLEVRELGGQPAELRKDCVTSGVRVAQFRDLERLLRVRRILKEQDIVPAGGL